MQDVPDQGRVDVLGRKRSGGATLVTASGPNDTAVAIPLNSTARVNAIPTLIDEAHERFVAPRNTSVDADTFVRTSHSSEPQSAASPRPRYVPLGYRIGR